MQWSAPLDRRGVEIESIEPVGNGHCAAILPGVTGVIRW